MFENIGLYWRRIRSFSVCGFGLGWDSSDPPSYEMYAMDWESMKADSVIGGQLSHNSDDYRWGTSRQGFEKFLTQNGRTCTHRNEFLLVKLEQTGPK